MKIISQTLFLMMTSPCSSTVVRPIPKWAKWAAARAVEPVLKFRAPTLAPSFYLFWLQLRLQHLKIFGSGSRKVWSKKQKNTWYIVCITLLNRNPNFRLWLHHLKYFWNRLQPSKMAWAPTPQPWRWQSMKMRYDISAPLTMLGVWYHVSTAQWLPSFVSTVPVVDWYRNLQSDWIQNFFINSVSNPYPKIWNYGLWYPIQIRNHPLSCTLAKIFGSVYFASWGKVVVILPLVRHDWLKWSRDKCDTHKKTRVRV